MPIDAAAAKFLYAIMKQVDVKKIDWQIVASEQGIPTANAARMRFTRLKAQMEGDTTTPTKSKTTVPRKRKEKAVKAEETKAKRHRQEDETDGDIANSSDMSTAIPGINPSKPRAKTQPKDKPTVRATSSAKTEPIVKYERVDVTMNELPLSTMQQSSNLSTEFSSADAEVRAKREHEQTDFAEDLA
ncbi:MAG: hypothetical protein Q9210_007119 [Variospora velana]